MIRFLNSRLSAYKPFTLYCAGAVDGALIVVAAIAIWVYFS